MIRLIVNADDLGSGASIDRGIFHGFAEGIVSSASILTTGLSFVDAAREARCLGLPVGVHLNLSEGFPLTGPIQGLTNGAGAFLGKTEARRALVSAQLDEEGLFREWCTQIERALEHGLFPDHLDTHQHAFLFPAATRAALRAANCFGISALRLPSPAEHSDEDPPGPLGRELFLYRQLAPKAAAPLKTAGFRTPLGLWGMPWLNRLNEKRLLRLLEALPPGCWELMVHPGHTDSRQPFAGPERERELSALTSPAARDCLNARGIRLIHFGDLP